MSDTLFDHTPPQFEADEIVRLAGEHFGAVGVERFFPSERDQNALCRLADGSAILVKIANQGEVLSALEFQTALLAHVTVADPTLGLPRPVRARNGQTIVTIHAPGGRLHYLRALTFIPGAPMAEAAKDKALWRALGRKLGRLSNALASFDHPAADHPDFLWNLDNAGAALAWAGQIADVPTRERVQAFIAARYEALQAKTAGLRRAVLYQDANDYNVLIAPGTPLKIAGFIDFGDAVRGRQINELAVALAYAAMDQDDPLSVLETLTAGYASVFALEAAEVEVLFDLVMLRLAQSVCISHHQAAAFPENHAYLTISQKPAQALIARLSALDPQRVHNRLRLAAGFAPLTLEAGAAGQTDALMARRRERIAPSLSVAYREPLTIVRGEGAYLYDEAGRPYLDLVNNVAHVGHCHPHVVAALSRQAGLLNTNARYLHPLLLDYADRIVATLPEPLSVCVFVCSGSEANELAIRMARAHTGRQDAVVLDVAYHGNTTTLVDISPYKFARKGGQGRKDFVHVAAMPDPYRGVHRGMTEAAGAAYAAEVAQAVKRSQARGGPAFFIAESYLGVGGQVIPPPGFLKGAYAAVRAAGGVCIADEVQVGLGRSGAHMWAFEEQGVVPDIVTLGKPLGAGHPMAVVVTTPEIARSFANGMEYFNTFGGNPVSCAVGMAVLDVIEDEDLMQSALDTGAHFQAGLSRLAERFELIGDVRGRGLFIGAELVLDRETREPATQAAGDIVNALRRRGVFVSTDGPAENVLKIKPPMVVKPKDADLFLGELEAVLAGG